jgi:predicted phage terminase large subunit-like protein
MLKHDDRINRIAELETLVELYEVKRSKGVLKGVEASKYTLSLRELAKWKRIEAGFQSIFVFGKTYFSGNPPHNLIDPRTPSAAFHPELCDLLRQTAMSEHTEQMAVAAPRSHAKSVWDTNIFPVWLTVYKVDIPTDPYWVIVGDDVDSARKQLDIVKMAIESNPAIIEDFGCLRGSTWNATEVVTSNGVKFEAGGMTQGIRGTKYGSYRPSVIFDDVETDESAGTPERIDKVVTKFDKTFMPLGDPQRSKFIFVGTVINYGSLLNQIMTRRGDWRKIKYKAIIRYPDAMHMWEKWAAIRKDFTHGESPEESTQIAEKRAFDFYHENKVEMDAGSEILWPERMDLYALMKKRDTNRLAFLSEFQNDPLDAETRLFKQIHYYNVEDVRHEELDFYYALDPSLGKNKRADFSAIIVVGKHRKTGIMYVIEADIRRRTPDRIILDLFDKHKHYRFKQGWVEGVAFQEFLRTEIQRRSAEAGIYIPADEFRTGNVNKDIRIAGIEPLVTNGYVRFLPSMTELQVQLEYFPKHDRKDGPDALSMVLDGIRSKSRTVVMGTL